MAPQARVYVQMAYVGRAQKSLLFGGNTQGSGYLGDTWLWDGEVWARVNVPEGGPSARNHHVMAANPDDGLVYMFGGIDSDPLGRSLDLRRGEVERYLYLQRASRGEYER